MEDPAQQTIKKHKRSAKRAKTKHPVLQNPTQNTIEQDESSANRASLPPELWDMIIQHLRESIIHPFLYETPRLSWLIHGPRLAETIKKRPDLAPLIREIRHEYDTGFEDLIEFSVPFYEMIAKLPSLETLVFRKRLGVPWRRDIKWTEEEDKVRRLSERCYLDEEFVREEVETHETVDGYISQAAQAFFEHEQKGTLGPANDPFGCGENPWEVMLNFEEYQEDLIDKRLEYSAALTKKTLFCGGILGDHKNARLPPKLRVCHIGTDSTLDRRNQKEHDIPTFNETLFLLKQRPEKICITGARFQWLSKEDSTNFYDDMLPSEHSTVKELVILNCEISMEDLRTILSFTEGLKSFTFRGPLPQGFAEEGGFPDLFMDHHDSIETLDLDVYWGTALASGLHNFSFLEKLTITPYSLVGTGTRPIMPLPNSLKSLTFRYEPGKPIPLAVIYKSLTHEGQRTRLPLLREITCEIPDNLSNPSIDEVCFQIEDWVDIFRHQNISLLIKLVPYPDKMPEYDSCSCENLHFYHRFSCHKELNRRNAEVFWPGSVDFSVSQYVMALIDGEFDEMPGFSDSEDDW
ncbi:hypothetical protein N7513_008396 [Penicillium frequentans]|nr:hypothetical protein N7513_008396 [Penicillium glabrum]